MIHAISDQNTFTTTPICPVDYAKESVPNNDFPETVSQDIKSVSTKEKILKIALPLCVAGVCTLQQSNITHLSMTGYRLFLGYGGVTAPAFMASAYLTLKGISLFLNQKSDEEKEVSITDRTFKWLKKIPKDFAIGVSYMPQNMALNIGVLILSSVILSPLSMSGTSTKFENELDKMSTYDLTVKLPFLEELFYRELIQGSCMTTMKLVNLMRSRRGKDILFSDKTINTTSRVISAVTYGLLHANQSWPQAISAGITSYVNHTWLYEKNGLFASFGLHFANNMVYAGLRALIT